MDNATDGAKSNETLSRIRIEQVAGSLENPTEGHSVEITTDEHASGATSTETKTNEDDDDEEVEPSVLQALSSEQLARRPSFKKILDDLSSADAALHKNSSADPLSAAAAATLQAHHIQAAIQQASASNPSLIPGLFQAAANGSGTSATSSTPSVTDATSQLSMMLPPQQQLQLQSALLNASSGVVQSLAAQTNIPATILSSALLNANMAATLTAASSNSAGVAGLPASNVKLDQSIGSPVDDSTRKREVRLMKNREAARECRRKKKEYVRCLENRVAVLESQNQALIGELRALKELYLPKSQD